MNNVPLTNEAAWLLGILRKGATGMNYPWRRFDEKNLAGFKTLAALRAALRELKARGLAEDGSTGTSGPVRCRATEEGGIHWDVEHKYSSPMSPQ